MHIFRVHLTAPLAPGGNTVILVDRVGAQAILNAGPDEIVRIGPLRIHRAHVISIEPLTLAPDEDDQSCSLVQRTDAHLAAGMAALPPQIGSLHRARVRLSTPEQLWQSR